MRRSGRILIILGVFMGLITAVGTFVFLGQQNPNLTEQTATRPVVVALQNISERGEISSEMVGVVNWPADTAPLTSFTSAQEVIGKIAVLPIYQGQLFVPQMILAKPPQVITATGSIASFLLPEGKVAMAFQIGEETGVAGAIQPGDTIDVLLTLQPGALTNPTTGGTTTPRPTTTTGAEGLPATQIMLQDVLVIHLGIWTPTTQGGNAPASSTGLLTLAIDRQDALALKGAQDNAGTITLVLRRVGDHKIYDLEPVNLQYLNKRFKFNLSPALSTGGR